MSSKEQCDIVVAVAGNPNVGKSTLFNVLTGETARVGNWPGVTVERKEGVRVYKNKKFCFVDLPGTYGISATSLEEIVAREYIISGEPNVVLVLVDGTAPERTLYLPIQILELMPNVVIAVTKADMTHKMGIHIHIDKLEARLGVPVVEVSAIQGSGIRELLEAILAVTGKKRGREKPLRIDYGGLEPIISEVEKIIKKYNILKMYPARWVAIRLLEGDPRLEELIRKSGKADVLAKIKQISSSARQSIGRDLGEIIAVSRFNFVDNLVKEIVVRIAVEEKTKLFEEIFQHEIAGVVFSSLFLVLFFSLVFTINSGFPLDVIFCWLGWKQLAELLASYSLLGLMDEIFSFINATIAQLLESYNVQPWLISLITDGIISGVGSVLSFLPLLIITFFLLSILEDSGLAARLAYSYNSLLSKFGLSGRAIYPIVISFGCNVPGILSSRTALEEEERQQLIFSVPFVPCQARLIVIIAFATAYFSSSVMQALVMFMVYAVSLIVAILTSSLFRRFMFRKKEAPIFLLEIPPIHKPSLKVVWWLTWDYSKHFLRKAGLIILSLSIVTWFLLNHGPSGFTYNPKESYAAILGNFLAYFLSLYGVPKESAWIIGFALIQGFIAKEGLIEAIALLEGGEANVKDALLALGLNPVQAFSLLILFTLYVPCIPTVAAIKQEIGKNSLTLLIILYMFAVAIALSLLVNTILSILAV